MERVYHVIKEIEATGIKTIMPERGGRIVVKYRVRHPFNLTIRQANKQKRNNESN